MKSERDLYVLKDEYFIFIKKCPIQYTLFWRVCFNAGLRISECLNLTAQDILYSENKLLIKTLKRKGHPIIPVIIPEYLVKELQSYIQKNEITNRIWPFSRQYAFKMFKQICKKGGLNSKYSPHSFRHGHGIMISDLTNGNMIEIKTRLRHASTRSTEFYVHCSEQRQKELSNKIENYLKGE